MLNDINRTLGVYLTSVYIAAGVSDYLDKRSILFVIFTALYGEVTINQIFEVAFSYYVEFYSFKGKLDKLWPWLIMTIISGLLFLYLTIIGLVSVYEMNLSGVFFLWEMKWTFVAEVACLMLLNKSFKEKENIVVEGFSSYSSKYRIVKAKREWISKACNIKEVDFLDFSEKLLKTIEIESLTKSKRGNGYSFSEYIYSPESKNRITSYFIFALSVISLLAIKDIGGLSEILPTLFDPSYQRFFAMLMLAAFISFLLLYGVIKLIAFSFLLASTVWYITTNSKTESYRFVYIFINDVIKMYRQPPLIIHDYAKTTCE